MHEPLSSDINAVRNAIARYVHHADDGDGAGVASLFTADGTLESLGATVSGRLALRELIERIAPACLKHITANSAVDVTGEVARAHTDVLLLAPTADGWQITGCGRYDDDLVKHGDVWLFRHRTISWHRVTSEATLTAVRQMLA